MFDKNNSRSLCDFLIVSNQETWNEDYLIISDIRQLCLIKELTPGFSSAVYYVFSFVFNMKQTDICDQLSTHMNILQ